MSFFPSVPSYLPFVKSTHTFYNIWGFFGQWNLLVTAAGLLFLYAMLGHRRIAPIFSYAELLTKIYLACLTSFSPNNNFIRPQTCLLFSICGRRDCNVFSHRYFSVPDLEPNSTAYGSSCKLLLKCHGPWRDQVHQIQLLKSYKGAPKISLWDWQIWHRTKGSLQY